MVDILRKHLSTILIAVVTAAATAATPGIAATISGREALPRATGPTRVLAALHTVRRRASRSISGSTR